MNPLPEITTLTLKSNKFGENTATLYTHPFQGRTTRAILYLHGFNDYFFQEHMARQIASWGFQFFALDLRRYGRSMRPHQKPNGTHDLSEYFEEITLALEHMQKKGLTNIALLGHSTGGLIASLYCHHFRDKLPIKALILNSPFLDFNMSAPEKAVLPLVAFLGKLFPNLPSPAGLKRGYGESVHQAHRGEWDFDTRIKPIEGWPVDLGWVHAIWSGQKTLQKGVDIPVPILVMYSSKSVQPGNFREDMLSADSVLNVEDIAKYALRLGKRVRRVAIKNGMHDLILSRQEVREEVFRVMKGFLDGVFTFDQTE